MDENQVRGTARYYSGKLQAEAARATGDTKAQFTGKLEQAAGAAQHFYGQTADSVRGSASDFDDWFRMKIEAQPYAVALLALGLGWALGRMRQPY